MYSELPTSGLHTSRQSRGRQFWGYSQFCIHHSAKFHIDSKVILGCFFRINTTESSSHNLIQECATLHKSTQLTQLVGAHTRPWRGLPIDTFLFLLCLLRLEGKGAKGALRWTGRVGFPLQSGQESRFSNLNKNLDFLRPCQLINSTPC